MDSTIISVQENVTELIHYSPLADVAIIKYVATWQAAPKDSLWTELNSYDILKDFIEQEETYVSLESRYQHALDHLGVLAADRYLYTYLESRIAAVGLSAQSQAILGDLSKLRNQIQLVRSFLEKHKPRFDIQVAKYDRIVSAKVWELAHLLGKYKSDKLQGIVFVERRDEVRVLAWLLPRLQDSEWISCASIVGHGGASEVASIGMTVKAQEATVREFREGKYQVLFASSVAEEGLDFQYLSLVVMFDGELITTFDIQCRDFNLTAFLALSGQECCQLCPVTGSGSKSWLGILRHVTCQSSRYGGKVQSHCRGRDVQHELARNEETRQNGH